MDCRELCSPDSTVIISSCAFCGPIVCMEPVSALGRGPWVSGLLSRAGAVNITYLLTYTATMVLLVYRIRILSLSLVADNLVAFRATSVKKWCMQQAEGTMYCVYEYPVCEINQW